MHLEEMDEGMLDHDELNPYTTNALNAVQISFVNSLDNFEKATEYNPDFAHQHFDNEKIFGYEDLQIRLRYSDVSMYVYPEISFSSKIKDPTLKPDDVMHLLKNQLPSNQMNMQVEDPGAFRQILLKQNNFKPFGNLISKFNAGDRQFEMYHVTESSEEFDFYLERLQSLALWYIDGAEYSDNTDDCWSHYLLHECQKSDDGSVRYPIAGWTSIYRFYSHPFKHRYRIAVFMLTPPYRRAGIGPKFLQAVYRDMSGYSDITDITVEDAADNCIFLRDYVDCVNCSKLPEFAPEKLKAGFSKEMELAASRRHKLFHKQTRRVYEILRLKNLNKRDDEEKNYRLCVKNRLAIPMRKSRKWWNKVENIMDDEEKLTLIAANSEEKIMADLDRDYRQTIEGYNVVIDRLINYPDI